MKTKVERLKLDCDLEVVKAYIDYSLAPIKKSIGLIMAKLNIQQFPEDLQMNFETFCQRKMKNRQRDRKESINLSKTENDQSSQSLQSIFSSFSSEELQLPEEPMEIQEFSFNDLSKVPRPSPTSNKLTEFKIPQPRGNNTTFGPGNFPPEPPLEDVNPQFHQQWRKVYKRVKQLIDCKKSKSEKGWFEYQKRILLDFVTKGAKFGCNPLDLIRQLGVSHSTFKRWRNYFK